MVAQGVEIDGHRAGSRALALALLLLAHPVTGAVNLSSESHGEAVAAPDGLLEQQSAQDARARADEVEREADEAEPVRRFDEGIVVGAVRDGDQLRLDTRDERALSRRRVVSCREAQDLIVYMMYYDTYDRDEGVNCVEKCSVAIRLFLQMLNWSFRFKVIKETRARRGWAERTFGMRTHAVHRKMVI